MDRFMCSDMHWRNECSVSNGGNAAILIRKAHQREGLSLRGTYHYSFASSASNIFSVVDEIIITRSLSAELPREDERGGTEIKNKFSACKNIFF